MSTDQDLPRPPPLDPNPNIPPLRETAARAESRRADLRNRFSGMIAGLAVAGILMGGSFWMGFQTGTKNVNPGDVPLILAETAPAKVAPEDPGGLQVPNQDKLVFEGVRENGDESEVTVAPPPEEPAPPAPSNLPRITETDQASEPAQESEPRRPIVVEGRDIAAETEVVETEVAEDVDPNETAARDDTATTEASSSSSDDGATVVAAVEVEQTPPPAPVPVVPRVAASETPTPTASTAPTSAAPTSAATETVVAAVSVTRIQVGAYRSLNAAMQGWKIIQTAHAGLLTGLEPTVVEVDLGAGKVIFHRLQAGPLTNVASANRLCESLRALKQGCLVVRP